eukprot:8429609-Alexandrium_andersonii.AAC.1
MRRSPGLPGPATPPEPPEAAVVAAAVVAAVAAADAAADAAAAALQAEVADDKAGQGQTQNVPPTPKARTAHAAPGGWHGGSGCENEALFEPACAAL